MKKSILNRSKKILKYVLLGIAVIYIIFFVSSFFWNMSGSNQWELKTDKNGIKIWTLKTPGSNLLKVKAVKRMKSKLSSLVKLIEDPNSCDDVGCTASKRIEKHESLYHYTAYSTFEFELPSPFATREYVVLVQHDQDPKSKKIEIHIIATPNKIMPQAGCVRVSHMHNIWRLTPLENGEVEVEYLLDFDAGGFMPYFLTNLAMPEETYKVFCKLDEIMQKERYKNAKLAYVKE